MTTVSFAKLRGIFVCKIFVCKIFVCKIFVCIPLLYNFSMLK